MEEEQGYVTVMEPRDDVAAALARGLLQNEGIPAIVQSFQIPWYNGIMTAAAGAWGRILVPARFAEAAARILAAYFGQEESLEESSGDSS